MSLKGRGILYYNNIWQDESFVIAKEEKGFNGYTFLKYVNEIKYKNDKPRITWCSDLDLLDFDAIKDVIIDKLYEEGYIKKNKNINKFSIKDIEQNLIEIIDEGLSQSIMNYFDNNNDSNNINFNNIDKFYCCYWE